MYKIFMLIAIPVLAIGWIAYILWERKMRAEEEKQPKQESQRLRKTKSEIADWAQQMAKFKKPEPKRTYDQDDENKAE